MPSGIIIFSRFDSSRLPGKALLDIGGRCLLQRVIDRARCIKGSPRVIVATSGRSIDQPIIDCANREGVDFFHGDLENVARRAFDCAKYFGLDYFARICGDRPFFDPDLVSCYLRKAELEEFDLVTNSIGSTFPSGITTEIVRVVALARLLETTQDSEDLEHLTRYFYRKSQGFKIHNFQSVQNLNDVSLVVDNAEDLARARFIVNRLGMQPELADTISVVAEARCWYRLNAK